MDAIGRIPVTILALSTVSVSLLVLALGGCATIFTGTTDVIHFGSNADPVRVYIRGRLVGTTPLDVTVKRQVGEGPDVRFEKDGYVTQQFPLEKEFNWVSVLDISSLLTSGGIDVLTGAIMKYQPKHYHVEMIAKTASSASSFWQRLEFARFVLINADKIKVELSSGHGVDIASMESLAGYPSDDNAAFDHWVRMHRTILIKTDNPEELLAALRTSRLTP